MKEGRQVLLKRFPEDLHKRLRVFAADKDTTMKAVILKALEEYLTRNGG